MKKDYSQSFTVDSLKVTTFVPSNNTSGVVNSPSIRIWFNRLPIISDRAAQIKLHKNDSTSDLITYNYDLSGDVVTLSLPTPLDHQTKYTVWLSKTICDVKKICLAEDTSISFTVGQAIWLDSLTVKDNDGDIPGKPNISLRFESPAVPVNPLSHISLSDKNNTYPLALISSSKSNVILQPKNFLKSGVKYTVTLRHTLCTEAGACLKNKQTRDFTTDTLKISSSYPLRNSLTVVNKPVIRVVFNKVPVFSDPTNELYLYNTDDLNTPLKYKFEQSGSTVSLTPLNLLTLQKSYKLLLKDTICDSKKICLATNDNIDFKVNDSIKITSLDATDNDGVISGKPKITISYTSSKVPISPLDHITFSDGTTFYTVDLVSVSDSKLVFTPRNYLMSGKSYTVTVANTFCTASGACVPTKFSGKFTVNTLQVKSFEPSVGHTGTVSKPEIRIKFDRSPVITDPSLLIKVYKSDTPNVYIPYNYGSTGNSVTLTIKEQLKYSAKYSVLLEENICDATRICLAKDKILDLTVDHAVAINKVSFADSNGNIPGKPRIKVSYSSPDKVLDPLSHVSLSNGTSDYALALVSSTNTDFTMTPLDYLKSGKNYVFSIKDNLCAASGICMPARYVTDFTVDVMQVESFIASNADSGTVSRPKLLIRFNREPVAGDYSSLIKVYKTSTPSVNVSYNFNLDGKTVGLGILEQLDLSADYSVWLDETICDSVRICLVSDKVLNFKVTEAVYIDSVKFTDALGNIPGQPTINVAYVAKNSVTNPLARVTLTDSTNPANSYPLKLVSTSAKEFKVAPVGYLKSGKSYLFTVTDSLCTASGACLNEKYTKSFTVNAMTVASFTPSIGYKGAVSKPKIRIVSNRLPVINTPASLISLYKSDDPFKHIPYNFNHSGNTVTLSVDQRLDYGSKYSIRLEDTMCDVVMICLPKDTILDFTVNEAVTVNSVTFTDASGDVPAKPTIKVAYNSQDGAVNPLSHVNLSDGTVSQSLELVSSSNKEFIVRPLNYLESGQKYTFTVSNSLCTTSGACLAADDRRSFTVGSMIIKSFTPSVGYKGAVHKPTIRIVFDRSPVIDTPTSYITLYKTDSPFVSIPFNFDLSRDTATLTVKQRLEHSSNYSIRLKKNLCDANRFCLSKDTILNFTVNEAVTVSSVTFTDASGDIPAKPPIKVTYKSLDKAIDPLNHVSLSDSNFLTYPLKLVSTSSTAFTVTPQNYLKSGKKYKLKISRDLCTTSGECLALDHSADFTTDAIKIVSSTPADKQTGVGIRPDITVVFNRSPVITDSKTMVRLYRDGSDTATYDFSLKGNTVLLDVINPLDSLGEYTVFFDDSIYDVKKICLAADTYLKFTVGGSNWGDWNEIVQTAPLPGREGHSAISFNNRVWVSGGQNNSLVPTDTLYRSSSDLSKWTKISIENGWPKRYKHAMTVFKGKIWIFGGSYDFFKFYNDAWYSADGSTWTKSSTDVSWDGRSGHSVLEFGGFLWLAGGYNGVKYLNDIYRSRDGITWETVTTNAAWKGRTEHKFVATSNKLWILGGETASGRLNDIWHSTNGTTWTQATPQNTVWETRKLFGVEAVNNVLYVFGGSDDKAISDVWKSADGTNWQKASPAKIWKERFSFAHTLHNGQIHLIGGKNTTTTNNLYTDVWKMVGY